VCSSGGWHAAAVSELTRLPLADPRWSRFTGSREEATPFHGAAWAGFLSECYGFHSFAAAVVESGDVVAGIPVAEVGRRRWVSLPFTDACAPLGDTGRLAAALEAARGRRVVEVRAPLPGAVGHAAAVGHVLALDADQERVFAGCHKSQVLRNIRRAEREGVEVRTATTEAELTDAFYALHVRTRRRLGAPVQRRRFFSLLWQRVLEPGGGYLLLAHHDGRAVAGAVFLTAGKNVVYKYGASDERHWSVRPNHLLFRDAIARSCAEGRAAFDFGRTDFGDTGLREFKRGWGASEHELVYSTLGGEAPARHRLASSAAAAARGVIRKSPPVVCRAAGLLYGRAA
jgi:CelD/BcsL family acetyltransferase involved in cellulose biosynthesis